MADEEGIEDTKLDGKHRKALERRRRECGQWGGYINTWAAAFRRATQCSLQFIRWFAGTSSSGRLPMDKAWPSYGRSWKAISNTCRTPFFGIHSAGLMPPDLF